MERRKRQRAQVEALFDRVAEAYGAVPFFGPFGVALVEWADPPRGALVLDLGTGRGAVLAPAARAVGPTGAVVGIEVSTRMLAALRCDDGVGSHVRLVRMDMERLGFADGSFDLVLGGLSLHIVADPQRAIREAWRVLRAGGELVFSVPGPAGTHRLDRYDAVRARYQARSDPRRWSMAPPPDLRALLATNGFQRVAHTTREVQLPIESPEAFWEMELSHGMRGWVDALDPDDRTALEREVLATLGELHDRGDLVLDRGAVFIRGTRSP